MMSENNHKKSPNSGADVPRRSPTVGRLRGLVRVVPAVVIIAAGLAAYFNSFSGVFVYDDIASIRDNPHIRALWPLTEAMSLPLLGSGVTVDGRPVLSLSLALNHFLLGPDPWGYHAVNLAIHTIAALLLFGIVRRTLRLPGMPDRFARRSAWLALAVALIWLVHPLQTASVTYIIQRAESLMGMFFLLTLYCAIRGFEGPRTGIWHAAAVAACLMGAGTKQVMAAAPLIVLLYDRTFAAGSFGLALRRRWKLYAGLAASWALLAWLFALAGTGNQAGELGGAGVSSWVYARTQFGVILYYLRLSVWPAPVLMDYGWPLAAGAAEVLLPGVLVAGLLAMTFWGVCRRHRLGFLGVWFFLILAPSSSFVVVLQAAQLQRMYLPLAAVGVLCVMCGDYLLDRLPRTIAVVAVAVLVAGLACLTHERNKDYHSALRLWQDNVAHRPDSVAALVNLGSVLIDHGQYDEAILLSRRAIDLNPNFPHAYNNIGYALARQDRHQKAAPYLERAVQIAPDLFPARVQLGVTLLSLGRVDEAVGQLERAVAINPRSARACVYLGRALAKQGRHAQAAEHFEKALELDPGDAMIHFHLGLALAQQGLADGAVQRFRKALEIDPKLSAAHANLGLVLARLGRPKEAIAHYKEALAGDKGLEGVHGDWGQALMVLGLRDEAIEHFRKELEINSRDINCRLVLGGALLSQDKLKEAIDQFRIAVELDPNNPEALNNLAWLLATGESVARSDRGRAVEPARRAVELSGSRNPGFLDTLAAAYAADGQFDQAVSAVTRAIELAKPYGNEQFVRELRKRLELYKAHKPYRERR